jgi:hypothetical protein
MLAKLLQWSSDCVLVVSSLLLALVVGEVVLRLA